MPDPRGANVPVTPNAFPARRVLFIHHGFPAHFLHLAQTLAESGCEIKAIAVAGTPVAGVDLRQLTVARQTLPRNRATGEMELVALRAAAGAAAMQALAGEGFRPDLIIAAPGRGESLHCKDIWPRAVLVAYGEFYWRIAGGDYAFDPEFSRDTLEGRARLRLRNTALLQAYAAADHILCPTEWQRSCLPADVRHKAVTLHNGIDTWLATPDPDASIELIRAGLVLTRRSSVLTFANRNLEPHRGFHVFMRALPEILKRNPDTHCIILGEDSISYGEPPKRFRNWREAMLHEVGGQLSTDRLHFVARLRYPDYLRVLQVSTCHVYMTYPFVLSLSCLEALCVGCRVVASDTAPVREVIRHGDNGLLVDFFDPAALADTVTGVLQDPARYDGMAAEAVLRARRDFDLRSVCLPRQLDWLAALLRAAARG